MATPRPLVLLTTVAALAAVFAAGCGGGSSPSALPRGSDQVSLDPADFTTLVDNHFWPMRPGSRWVYRETDGSGSTQRVVVTVTGETKQVMGIDALVVHDVVSEDGQVVEDTFDWYAQDNDGNVWYLGEDTKEFENGKLATTAGSWEAGVDGAEPGILLPGEPEDGLVYRQEYYAGEAEDAAEVLSLHEKAEVPAGMFEGVLMTKEYTPLDPSVLEYKLYAPGVGPALAVTVAGGSGREELTSYSTR